MKVQQVAEPGEDLDLYTLRGRVQLLVDGKQLDCELRPVLSDEVAVFGDAFLELGEHEATIRIRRTSSAPLTYTWRFAVVSEEPRIPGLPWGFQFVRPLPDSTITRQAYREGHLVPSYYLPGGVYLAGGVCVGVLGYEIAGFPSRFTAEEVQEMFSIASLDGRPPDPEAEITGGYEVPGGDIGGAWVNPQGTPVSGILGHDVSAHHYKCWVGDLAPGRHQATAVLEWPDGHVTEFTWWFVITE